MNICPKCRGLYQDTDTICQECNITLTNKDFFQQAYYEFENMNKKQKLKNRFNERYETICKYHFNDIYNYEQEQKELEKFYKSVKEKSRNTVFHPTPMQSPNVPKCPTCGSTNTKRISTANRAVSIGLFGLLSGKIGKNYECRNCKAKW